MALTKYNYNSFNVTPVASKALAFNSDADGFTTAAEGNMVLIKTLTASSDSTLEFVDGTDDVVLDNTYPIYLFKFINIHLATDEANFQFNFSIDTGSNYNVTKTTTTFEAHHEEDDSPAALTYDSGQDLAQGTGFQNLYAFLGADADQSCSGKMWIFNPSSTTFVKHFISRNSGIQGNNRMRDNHYAGYANTTSAVDAVQFKSSSGNIDAGTFKLYGIKDS